MKDIIFYSAIVLSVILVFFGFNEPLRNNDKYKYRHPDGDPYLPWSKPLEKFLMHEIGILPIWLYLLILCWFILKLMAP